jgi:aspartate dehydrogenase
MLRVGLVGCGTIGTQLAIALQRRYANRARITALHDSNPAHARALQRRLRPRPPVTSLPQLLRACQLVIEAASVEAASCLVGEALRAGRDVFVMSVGALAQDRRWPQLARRAGRRVYIPSGALAGLDGVKAMALGRIRRVRLTTRKPPGALAAAPFVRRRRLRLERLARPVVLFEGSPRQVVRAFPQNTNVAAALALAAGPSGARARIRVVADPALRRNVHEVDVEADCGAIRCRVESRPSANPKTSELAVRSAVAALGRIFGEVQLGT